MPTRHGSTSREVKLPGEKHRGRLEDLVRPAQLVVLTPQSTDLLALLAAEQLGAGARIGLRLAHAPSPRLRMDPQIVRDVGDRPLALQRQPYAALDQLIGILLRTGH